MICGIDLGTTNSIIGYGDNLFSGLVNSSVDISTGKQVDRNSIGSNIISSYKVNMTTGESGKLPMECSSIILRSLVDKAISRTGEYIEDVIVSVPAKFTHTQRQAVWKAAENAGLTIHSLINEPTAAALCVCKDNKDLVVVYDLGGGTFDVTILDSRVGKYFVVATDGNGHLAGDNFDKALVNRALSDMKVKMRFQTKDALKVLTRDIRNAKEAFQKNGLTQYIDMSLFDCSKEWALTEEIYISLMKSTFEPTVKLTKHLIPVNLSSGENPKLVFVGGSTACPYLRKWVKEEVGLEEVECNIQPDLIVAKGVSIFAKMVEDETAEKEIDDVTKCLCIENERGMADVIIEKDTIIPVTENMLVSNDKTCSVLEINLYQGDAILCRENDYIGTLRYDYGVEKEAGTGLCDIEVTVNRDGIIVLTCTEIETGITKQIDLKLK